MFAMAPELASEMMGEFLGLLSGYAIAEHMTPFKIEEIGTAVLPDWATIESLHTGKDLSSNQFFDGNGITTTDLTLVKDGVLKELFLSKAAAERLNLPPNGQAGPINVVLKGILPKTDLTGAKFLFTFLAGMHTMDSATGNFALEGEGYEIREDGSLGNFIKNVGLSGNIKQLFATMLGTLHDTPDYGSIRMPTLIFAPRHITPPTPLSE
jgi:predicted Zn-dependent protease